MRCPERLARIAALAFAAPEDVRRAIDERLHAQLPEVAPADYALGAAAFDPELRARMDAGAEDAKPAIARGAALWKRKFKDGRSLASCFPNGGRRVAVAYPQYHPRLKLVFTLEMAINQCLKAHHEPLLDYTDPATMGAITAYVRSLSNGFRIAVRAWSRESWKECM